MSLLEAGLLLPVFVIAWIGTEALRRYGLARLLDIPNARSSHTQPVPRGGGVAIVLAWLLGLTVLHAAGAVPQPLWRALAGGGLAVALIGFLDDHRPLPARVRLAVHAAAALWAVVQLGGIEVLRLGPWTVELGTWAGGGLAVLALVWLLNLYNFMDGIDGIAGAEALVCAFGGVLLALVGGFPQPGLGLVGAAAAGFLMLNRPPARIFMGDAGSGFLGYVFGVHALSALQHDTAQLWGWLLLPGVFVVDATVTLLRRRSAGAAWAEPHRSHAYQRAARRCGAHRPVTLAVFLLGLVWLLPLAVAAVQFPRAGVLLAVAGLAPLVVLVRCLGAGREDGPQP